MSEYFVTKNVANMMKESNPDSALDSQAIAGTLVTVEKKENDYRYVRTPDSYHGWIAERRLIKAWDRSVYKSICVKSLFAPVYAKPDMKSDLITKLVIGTHISMSEEINNFVEILLPDKQIAYINKDCVAAWQKSPIDEIDFEEKWSKTSSEHRIKVIADLGKLILKTAKLFMGTPYLWGGCTPFGLDCSGTTQLAYRLNGIQLLRDSYMQYDDKRFNKIEQRKALDKAILQAGDLLFFDIKGKGKVDHIGIACGDNTFIQARGEMLDGGTVISQCSDALYKQAFVGVCRLSPEANIHVSFS